MKKVFLIFSGHNDRAVVALCRALSARGLPFCLVASSLSDPILRTAWASSVVLVRADRSVSLRLFEQVRRAVVTDIDLVYCPTTEFINAFVLENREALRELGVRLTLPPQMFMGN
jgi:hypothetical protein